MKAGHANTSRANPVTDMTPRATQDRSLLHFAWADAKAALRTAFRVFAWTSFLVGLAVFAAMLLNPRRVEPLTASSLAATLLASLVYATLPGMVVAIGAALFRMAGAWAFVPLIVFPVIAAGVFWVGGGVLAGQGQDILSALGSEIRDNSSTLGGLKVHSIELMLMVLLVYGLFSALQPVVLWQLLQYLLLVSAFIGIALLLTCAITLPPLLFAIGRRTRSCYAEFVDSERAP